MDADWPKFPESYDDCCKISRILAEPICTKCNYSYFPISKHENCETGGLSNYCKMVLDTETGKNYGKPMVWIGMYIAAASVFCTLAMVADLFHGFRNRKFWFPCKYFTLNAASLTVITIAMKLPVDLNDPMPGSVDQMAKHGSMAFMCTMMANLMPSLASMDDKVLFVNVIGLAILVITMVVNVLIQFKTGVVSYSYMIILYMNVGTMLSLLIILTSSAMTIPTSKRILESKYQAAHKRATGDEPQQNTSTSTIDELIQHVKRYWVMAGTCNPQFVMASTPLCCAAGIICVPVTMIHFLVLYFRIFYRPYYPHTIKPYDSCYKWSMLVILITQAVGIAVGTIFRCFSTLSFKLSIKWSRNHIEVFKVEKYWTQKLSEWKQSHLGVPFSGRRSKALVHNLKNTILSLCIVFQKVIVVSCKIMGLIPIFVVIFVLYCLYCWKLLKTMFFWKLLKTMFFPKPSASGCDTIQDENDSNDQDIKNYVLKVHDELELSKRTLKSISNSVNRLIQKAEKRLPGNLVKLLDKSTGFEGVEDFDSDQVQPLLCDEPLNNWSLPIVTLTCIAITLPDIGKNMVDSLFKSVGEGLLYIHLVEETLNNASEYITIQRAAVAVWYDVEDKCMWLDNTLQRNAYHGKTSKEIIKWFADKAKEIVVEINNSSDRETMENSPHKLIVANSMYRIAQTILLNCQSDIEKINEEQMFSLLSGMIADIVAACLTNLPRVISMKCHESVIEKREASVEAAIVLLGRTKEIINKLQVRKLPSLDLDHMAFIDQWRVHMKQSIP